MQQVLRLKLIKCHGIRGKPNRKTQDDICPIWLFCIICFCTTASHNKETHKCSEKHKLNSEISEAGVLDDSVVKIASLLSQAIRDVCEVGEVIYATAALQLSWLIGILNLPLSLINSINLSSLKLFCNVTGNQLFTMATALERLFYMCPCHRYTFTNTHTHTHTRAYTSRWECPHFHRPDLRCVSVNVSCSNCG